jgi:hypothetical protein
MKQEAKKAGLLYLMMAVFGAYGIMYANNSILVSGDAIQTAQNLINKAGMLKSSILSGLIGQTAFIFLALSLNQLFFKVDDKLNTLLMVLVIAAVPIAFIINLCLVGAFLVLDGSEYLKVFSQAQLNALSLLLLNLYNYGLIIVQVFWGLWLMPLGLLFIKANFSPNWIGYLLIVGCFSYLLIVFIGLIIPQYNDLANSILILPLAIGEFSTIAWLLITGLKRESLQNN